MRRPQKFAQFSSGFWRLLSKCQPWGRLRKFLWPSQKSWTLTTNFVFIRNVRDVIICSRYLIEWALYSKQVSSIERQISLAFSIIAHDQFSLLETLIASLFRPHNSYCIFVDAKATTEFHNMVKQLVDCYKYQYPQARFKFNF